MFKNRVDAGRQLAQVLKSRLGHDVVVIGLPRGGVPVAQVVSQILGAPLDLIIVRKLGVTWQQELAFGALGEDGQKFLNKAVLDQLAISHQVQDEVIAREGMEIKKRQKLFRREGKPAEFRGKSVLIIDDGIATGATVHVACDVARKRGAKRIVIAAPVAAREAVRELSRYADEIYVLLQPAEFFAVGQWYEDFSPTSDEDVINIMNESRVKNGS